MKFILLGLFFSFGCVSIVQLWNGHWPGWYDSKSHVFVNFTKDGADGINFQPYFNSSGQSIWNDTDSTNSSSYGNWRYNRHWPTGEQISNHSSFNATDDYDNYSDFNYHWKVNSTSHNSTHFGHNSSRFINEFPEETYNFTSYQFNSTDDYGNYSDYNYHWKANSTSHNSTHFDLWNSTESQLNSTDSWSFTHTDRNSTFFPFNSTGDFTNWEMNDTQSFNNLTDFKPEWNVTVSAINVTNWST